MVVLLAGTTPPLVRVWLCVDLKTNESWRKLTLICVAWTWLLSDPLGGGLRPVPWLGVAARPARFRCPVIPLLRDTACVFRCGSRSSRVVAVSAWVLRLDAC